MSSITAWRIVKATYASTAFSGEGAKRDGGRWNSVGIPIVYLAESRALAVLEVLVHLEADDLLKHYRLISLSMDAKFVKALAPTDLPENWKQDPPARSTIRLGDRWFASGESAVLRVPSAIVPAESNLLLNPAHPDFEKMKLGIPQLFRFDRRLGREAKD
jgi:RES domain-containing protein